MKLTTWPFPFPPPTPPLYPNQTQLDLRAAKSLIDRSAYGWINGGDGTLPPNTPLTESYAKSIELVRQGVALLDKHESEFTSDAARNLIATVRSGTNRIVSDLSDADGREWWTLAGVLTPIDIALDYLDTLAGRG